MKYKDLKEIERYAAHDSCAFMFYFLGKMPYACQEDWAKRLDDEELLWEADFEPRDHGKSELFVVAYPLRRICLNPNIRILIVKNTKRAAEKSISVIKYHLESNERIKAFYAPYWQEKFGVEDICNSDPHDADGQSAWGADRFYVKRTVISQDPTVEGVGVGGAITGGHYDLIILDDVEDPARLVSDVAYGNQIDWYTGTILQLREPWTKVAVVGTFKRASGDLYELVRSNPMYSTTVQSSVISPALDEITYDRVFNDEGRLTGVENIKPNNIRVLCPEKWTIERLLMDREGALTPGMSSNTWRREKMNDLRAFKETVFKREWFQQRYNPDECKDITKDGVVRPFFKAIITGWDTAHTDKKTNNRSAFSVGESIGIGDRGYYLLPNFYRAQVEFPILKREVIRKFLQDRPNVVIIEYKDTGISLVQELRKPFDFEGQMLTMPLLAYEPDSDKIARAHASTPAWESGLVWLPQECQLDHDHAFCVNAWLAGWVERHVDFPESTYRDDVDVTSMLMNYAQRIYPLYGIKNDLQPLGTQEDGKLKSRAIGVTQRAGVFGRPVMRSGVTSRVGGIPGRHSTIGRPGRYDDGID